MEIESTSGFLRKRGPHVVPPPECLDPCCDEFDLMLVGKFVDDKRMEEADVKEWV